MARANDGNELSKLNALIEMMRSRGVIKYDGPIPDVAEDRRVELLLGPPLPQKTKEVEKDPRAQKRAHYANLLGRVTISDAELDLLPEGT